MLGIEQAARSAAELARQLLAYSGKGHFVISLFEKHAAAIDVVILDLEMPTMRGDEIFAELRRIDPKILILISSGYSELDVKHRLAGQSYAGFIHKPYRTSELIAAVDAVIGA